LQIRTEVVKGLHFCMLLLCLIATLVLLSNPSTGVKVAISLILVLYTLSILFKTGTAKLLFQLGDQNSIHA
jgi:hypothetical protein